MKQRLLLSFLVSIFICSSCKNQTVNTKPSVKITEQKMDPIQKNIQDIETYLQEKNLTAKKTDNNLFYIITREGNGNHPTAANNITIHYKGYYLDGETFDSSYDKGEPITYPLSGFILGWKQGIPMISEGGAGQLFVPSNLGYGAYPPPGVRPNAVLIFDVELLKINN